MNDETCAGCDHEYDLHYVTFGSSVTGCAGYQGGKYVSPICECEGFEEA